MHIWVMKKPICGGNYSWWFSRICHSMEALSLQKHRSDILLKLGSPTMENVLNFTAHKTMLRVFSPAFQGCLIIRMLFVYSLLLATQIDVVM